MKFFVLFCSGFLTLTLSLGSQASARVFSYKESSFFPYLRGTGGLSALRKDPFAHSSGVTTSVDALNSYNFSGEFGFVFRLGSMLNARLAGEVIQSRPITGALGTSPAGAERFAIDSLVQALNPHVTFEYIYETSGDTRFYWLVGAGWAQVTVENNYTMTATGTTDLGVSSFRDLMGQDLISYQAGTGFETLFADHVTLALDFGYRYLPVSKMTYKETVQNILSPSGVQKGANVVNPDGSRRKLDLSGLFLGLALRFHL